MKPPFLLEVPFPANRMMAGRTAIPTTTLGFSAMLAACAGIVGTPVATAAIDYVDATAANTTLADGTAMNLVASSPANPQDYTTSTGEDTADNRWHVRTTFGNGSNVWNSTQGTTPFSNDCPTLKTTITGLTPGQIFNVYAYYWVSGYGTLPGTPGGGPAAGNNQWDIKAGLSDGSLATYTYNTAGVTNLETLAGTFSGTVLTGEGNRRLFQAKVGVAVANGSGEIAVFVDDNPGNDDRTWYDGVGTEISNDRIWDGDGPDALWSTAENWLGGTPVSGSPLTFGGDLGLDNQNNLAPDTSIAGITFNPGAGAFDLAGNRITLSGDIVNSSGSSQVLTLPLLLDGNRTITGPVFLDGAISGPFGLIKNDASVVELAGANDYTGPLTVNRGTVNLDNDQTGANGGMTIGPASANATLVTLLANASAAVAAGNQVAIGNPAAAGTVNQAFNVSGTMTNAGSLQLRRTALLNINDGGHWTQSGDAALQGVGGFSNDLNVNSGGIFEHTAASTFKLNGAPGNGGQARLNIAGTGVFITGTAFEQVTVPTTGFGRIALGNGGTLRLSADVAQLTLGVQMLLNAGGGVIDTAGFSSAINAAVSGAGGLTKAGTGSLTLNSAPVYTGDTQITGGILALDAAGLADEAAVIVGAGTTLNLAFTGSDTVGSLYLGADPNPKAAGTYGRIGSIAALGADVETALITGDGLLTVAPAAGFANWASGLGLTSDPEDDFDQDGLDNAIEFVLGSDPKASTPQWASTLNDSGDNLVFTFTRDDASETLDVTTTVEVSSNLADWLLELTVGADTASSTTGITVEENGSNPDLITVTLAKDGDPAMFARLKATVTP